MTVDTNNIKGNDMKNITKKILKRLLYTLLFMVIAIALFIYIFFYSTIILRQGELLKEVISPDKSYKAMVYIDEYVEQSTRVEIVNIKNNKKRLIYWSWDEGDDPIVLWVDNNTININRRILNIHKDKFDKRTSRDTVP
jgi:hypothetical protein